MSTEQLRLEATVVDRFSKPLTDLRNKLQGVKSPAAAGQMSREFGAAHTASERLARSINANLGAAVVRIGASVGGLAGAFFAVSLAARRFTDEIPRLQSVARETGVSVNNLRALSAVARQVNIDAGDVERGVKTLAENLHDIVRRRGNVWIELLKVAPNLADQLRQAGVEKDVDKALDVALDAIMTIRRDKGAVQAKRYSELIFGVDLSRFGEMTRDELKAALQKAASALSVTDDMADRAKALRRAFERLKDTFVGVGDATTDKLAPGLTKLVEATERLVSIGGKMNDAFVTPLNAVLQALEGIERVLNGDKGSIIGGLLGAVVGGAIAGPKGAILGGTAGAFAGGRAGDALAGTDQSRLAEARDRLAAIDKWLRANPGAENTPFGRNMAKGRVEAEEEIRRLERAIEEGAAKGAKEGVEKGLESGARKSGYMPASWGGGGLPGLPGGSGGGGGWSPVPGGGAPGGGSGGGPRVHMPGPGAQAQGSVLNGLRIGSPSSPGRNAMFDLIGRAEGTDRGRGYNETLAYGLLTGGPQNLTGMTLDQIDKLQTSMLRHPRNRWNSSALGRYQIVRKTLRGLRRQLGLKGDELYDEAMQDRLADALLRRRGGNVAGLRNEWEGLRRVDPGRIMSAFDSWRRGGATASNPEWPQAWKPGSAWGEARAAGAVGGGQKTTVEGKASLDVTLNGFPPGWRARADGGGLFREVDVNRGRALVAASEE